MKQIYAGQPCGSYAVCSVTGDCSRKPCQGEGSSCWTCSGSGTEKNCISTSIPVSPCHTHTDLCGYIVKGICIGGRCIAQEGPEEEIDCIRETCWNE